MKQENHDDAFDWLDEHLPESLESPDEAFDWIFMLHSSGWTMLETVWDQRPAEWREALAYIAGEGPIRESQSILRRALFDANLSVATEAARSICHHHHLEPKSVDLDKTVIARLRVVLDQNGGKNMEEVDATLAGSA
jgi:hypothetical protein